MTLVLQIIVALAIIVVVAFLVPFLIQLRRTAQSVEILAHSAKSDLNKMTEDVHQIRLQTDKLTESVREALDVPCALSRTFSSLAQIAPPLFAGKGGGSGVIGLLASGFQTAVSIIRQIRSAGKNKET